MELPCPRRQQGWDLPLLHRWAFRLCHFRGKDGAGSLQCALAHGSGRGIPLHVEVVLGELLRLVLIVLSRCLKKDWYHLILSISDVGDAPLPRHF